ISPAARLALYVLANFSRGSHGEHIFPSVPTIAKRMGMSEPSVRAALGVLLKTGVLHEVKAHTNKAPNVYRIDFHRLKALALREKTFPPRRRGWRGKTGRVEGKSFSSRGKKTCPNPGSEPGMNQGEPTAFFFVGGEKATATATATA